MIEFRFKDGASPTLKDFADQFPKQFPKAMRDLGAWARKTISAQLRAGQPAGEQLAPLDPLTIQLREANPTFTRTRKIGPKAKKQHRQTPLRMKNLIRAFGGRLPDLIEYQVEGGTLRVGFLGNIFAGSINAAVKFQESEERPFNRYEHAMIRRLLGEKFKQPTELRRPARPIITPYLSDTTLASRAAEIIQKSIQAQLDASVKKGLKYLA